jgi:2,4-dienoyl-CoA reductase-like NADH-dependent reductase (Old Yellow Enzyme family)
VRPEKDYVTPRPLDRAEIPAIIAAFRRGAENAMKAGFDGVHIHGANGYLLDQFLQDSTNKRSDDYGGSLENRARLMLEVTDACIAVWGADRVGMHLAPRMDSHDMGDSDRLGTFLHVARQLGARKLGWIAAREAEIGPDTKLVDSQGRPREIRNRESIGPAIKAAFGGAFIANEGFELASAQEAIAQGRADAVAFGKLFIANPDLPKRFAEGLPVSKWDSATFYSGGAHGYSDYPAALEMA